MDSCSSLDLLGMNIPAFGECIRGRWQPVQGSRGPNACEITPPGPEFTEALFWPQMHLGSGGFCMIDSNFRSSDER